MKSTIVALFAVLTLFVSCDKKCLNHEESYLFVAHADSTLSALYKNYGVQDENLLRETFPFDDSHKATYLASSEQTNAPNQFSYLWPYSGTFSAVNALYEKTGDVKYKELLDSKVLPGLEEYFDVERNPYGYASYVNRASQSDRFYDDNVWLGIDFTDLYQMTKEDQYLSKARVIWDFVISGSDDLLGGGIYWCEQKKGGKNTCSNAPGSVFALKLFEATADSTYFEQGKFLYEWTKTNLQDESDNLYFDNINLEGKVDKTKYAYNSGQMLQSAVLLYKLTGDVKYLNDAKALAKACHSYFFQDFTNAEGEGFKLIKNGDIWFTAVMSRGFLELYTVDKDPAYIESFHKNLNHAWSVMRDSNGLFNKDWTGKENDEKKWLLTQAAMIEMYARFSCVK